MRLLVVVAATAAVSVVAGMLLPEPKLFRAAVVVGACLALWLSEAVPLYATTLILWAATAVLLGPLDPKAFGLPRILTSAASPVLALFFGGFALSAAATKHGVNVVLAEWVVRSSRGWRLGLLAAVMGGTALLSMWMSNVAAAAMVIAALRPIIGPAESAPPDGARGADFRRALLLGVAFAADFGGIGTPIGTGPNLIAIGAVADRFRVRFVDWMVFGVPLALLMVALAFVLLARIYRVGGRLRATAARPPTALAGSGWAVVILFLAAVAAWVLEPLHGVPASVTALAIAAVLFASGLLEQSDLNRLEWNTLLLIAGGITLGDLLHTSGLDAAMAGAVNWAALPRPVLLVFLALTCALMSAVASNTAAAAVMVSMATGIDPSPSVALTVAMGASMGVPFIISTPPNSVAYGQGGLSARDFLVPGAILMVVGCALVGLTGPAILKRLGLP